MPFRWRLSINTGFLGHVKGNDSSSVRCIKKETQCSSVDHTHSSLHHQTTPLADSTQTTRELMAVSTYVRRTPHTVKHMYPTSSFNIHAQSHILTPKDLLQEILPLNVFWGAETVFRICGNEIPWGHTYSNSKVFVKQTLQCCWRTPNTANLCQIYNCVGDTMEAVLQVQIQDKAKCYYTALYPHHLGVDQYTIEVMSKDL